MTDKRKPTHVPQRITVLAAILLISILVGLPAAAATVSSPNWSMAAGPSADEPVFGEAANAVLPSKGIVIASKGGQMLALNVKTGERLWKFGSELLPYFYAAGDNVYAVSRGGLLFSVDAQGKQNWSARIGAFQPGDRLVLLDKLYVLRGDSIQALRPSSGQLVWEQKDSKESAAPSEWVLQDRLLLGLRTMPDATTRKEIAAYDPATGGILWRLEAHQMPFFTSQGELLAFETPQQLPVSKTSKSLTLDRIDPRTGKVLKSYMFRHTLTATDAFSIRYIPEAVLGPGNMAYVIWGDAIEVFNLSDPVKMTVPIRSMPQPKQVYPTGAVLYGQLLMENPINGQASAVQLETGKHVTWDDEKTPFYRSAVIGSGLYQMYGDGTLAAYDLRTGVHMFTAATGQGGITNLLRSGDYLIIVKAGKLNGYTLTEALR